MRVVVTGSAGRIGRAACDALLNAGHKVVAIDRRSADRTAPGYREITASLDDASAMHSAVEHADAVLHLGAFMSWAPDGQAEMYRSNVDAARILLGAAEAARVRRFVFASSGEVYPENAPREQPITEAHPLNPNSPYGLTKLLGEELVRFHQRRGLMETVILRFSHTQSADELLDEESFFSGPRFFLRPRIRQQEAFGNDKIAQLLRQLDPGVPAHILARNETGRPYQMHITDTRDMVAGLLAALHHPAAAGETFNLGATEPVEFEPLIERMSEITGYPIVAADLPGPGVHYRTSNAHIRATLGFDPVWTIDRMIEDAATAWRERSAA